jgi:pyruvate formate lyase activating enzyme
MDVKSSASRHDAVTGGKSPDREAIEESIDLLMAAGIDYEFRTTVVIPLHDFEEIKEIGKRLRGAKHWALQAFRPSPEVPLEGGLSAPPRGTLEAWKAQLEKDLAMDQIELRTGY